MGLFDELKKSAFDSASGFFKSALDIDGKSSDQSSQDDMHGTSEPARPSENNDTKLDRLHNQIQSYYLELKQMENEYLSIHDTSSLQEELGKLKKLTRKYDSVISDYQDEVESHVGNLEEALQERIDEIDNEDEEETVEHKSPSPAHSPAMPAPPPSSEFAFYAIIEGTQRGPYDKIQFKRLVDNNLASATTMVWKEGMEQWKAAKDVDNIRDLFGIQMTPPSIPNIPQGPPPMPNM
jgi:gas vesicle protein